MNDVVVSNLSQIESVTPDGAKGFLSWLKQGNKTRYARFTLATLSAIPWVGGLIGALGGLSGEREQDKTNDLLKFWVQEHQVKIAALGNTLQEIFSRLDQFGEEIDERLQSEEYMAIVTTAFRQWDEADTEEKRQLYKKLITNAAATPICPDDLIRLFLNWIELYHESHFAVIKQIYTSPGISRSQMWDESHTERPREDSSEADLFRYLIRDLSTGGVIRQARETDGEGRFLRQSYTRRAHSQGSPRTMETAFEESKPYVLTELGKQFVHFVLDDVVTRVESTNTESHN